MRTTFEQMLDRFGQLFDVVLLDTPARPVVRLPGHGGPGRAPAVLVSRRNHTAPVRLASTMRCLTDTGGGCSAASPTLLRPRWHRPGWHQIIASSRRLVIQRQQPHRQHHARSQVRPAMRRRHNVGPAKMPNSIISSSVR